MSLVEQTIARLKKQQGKPVEHVPSNRSPHGSAPAPVTNFEDTASLAKRIPIDFAALRQQGYFPEQDRDRQFADQYRRIKRALIDKALAGNAQFGEPRSIMVTSALPGDGKTFTSINLALSLALERDVSVLLVDADVAKRHISGIFGLTGMAGLVDILLDANLEPESLIVPTTTRGLSILSAGKRVDGPAELMSSSRMREVLATLCQRNSRRIVLLDSPPLLVTNEGRSLVKMASQVCLVVRSGATPRPAVQAALELFDPEQAGGVVLNDAPGVNRQEYYAYGYGTYGADGAQT